MTVADLIERLQEQDQGAEIRLMTQESWPFENAIVGVTTREEIPAEPDDEPEAESADNCVFIVEGAQLCYGDKNAWHVAG